MKKKFLISLKIAVSFGLLGGLFWLMRKDAGDILAIISSADLRWLAAALVILICNMATIAFRLKIVFHGENLNLPFGEALRLNFIGYFFNNFMPTAVGGDIMKAHCAGSYTNSRMRSYASVMMDRVIGLYSFLIVAAIALIADRGRFQIASIRFIVFSFLICGIAAFVAVTNKKIADILERFFLRIKLGGLEKRLDSLYKLVHDYRNRLDIVGKSLLVSLVSQSMYFIVIYIYFYSMGTKISIGHVFLIMPVVTFITMIPSIGGLGVREGAIVAFFSPLAGKETAFAVSLLLLCALFVISVIGGICYLHWSLSKKRKKPEDADRHG